MPNPSIRVKTGTRVFITTLVSVALFTVISCSSETRQLFFDIPPSDVNELADQPKKQQPVASTGKPGTSLTMGSSYSLFPQFLEDDSPPPAIESEMDWEKVEEMLPKDEEDNVNWSEALRRGLIRPRTGSDPRTLLMTTFQWDFIIPAPVEEEDDEDEDEEDEDEEDADEEDEDEEDADEEDEDEDEDEEDTDEEGGAGNEDDAYFPHSAHTQWLSCKNCHMTIYPYRRNPATMKDMKKGQSCGVCHGKNKVAFSLKACDRCHLNSE